MRCMRSQQRGKPMLHVVVVLPMQPRPCFILVSLLELTEVCCIMALTKLRASENYTPTVTSTFLRWVIFTKDGQRFLLRKATDACRKSVAFYESYSITVEIQTSICQIALLATMPDPFLKHTIAAAPSPNGPTCSIHRRRHRC